MKPQDVAFISETIATVRACADHPRHIGAIDAVSREFMRRLDTERRGIDPAAFLQACGIPADEAAEMVKRSEQAGTLLTADDRARLQRGDESPLVRLWALANEISTAEGFPTLQLGEMRPVVDAFRTVVLRAGREAFGRAMNEAAAIPAPAAPVEPEALGAAMSHKSQGGTWKQALEAVRAGRSLYLINVSGDAPWLLGLEGRTWAEAERALAWQERGGFAREDYRVCFWDAKRGAFFDGRKTYLPGRGAFTVEAWERFRQSLPGAPSVLGPLEVGEPEGPKFAEPVTAAGGWALVHDETLAPVCKGDVIKNFRGEPRTVTGGAPPLHGGSSGRVHTDAGEFYPGTMNLHWARGEG